MRGILVFMFVLAVLAAPVSAGIWYSPVGVIDSTSNNTFAHNASATIDGNLGTHWTENFTTSPPAEFIVDSKIWEWGVTYDLGLNTTISSIRIYTNPGVDQRICKIGGVKVHNTTNYETPNSKGACGTGSSTSNIWISCSITESTGRYITVYGGRRHPFGHCEDEMIPEMSNFYEFQVYAENFVLAPYAELLSPGNASTLREETNVEFSAIPRDGPSSVVNITLHLWNSSGDLIFKSPNYAVSNGVAVFDNYTLMFNGNYTWNYKVWDISLLSG